MPSSSDGFAAASGILPDGEGRWRGELAEGWDIVGRTNGGYMLSILSRASTHATGGRTPVSITGHFTAPGTAGPISIDTSVVRSGRTLSVVRSRLEQDGRTIVEALGAFAEPSTDPPEVLLKDATPIDLPAPESIERILPAGDAPFPPPFMDHVDLRMSPRGVEAFTTGTGSAPALEGWLRLPHGEPLDVHALIMATDAFPPTAFASGLPMGWTPTIELTVHVRDPRPPAWIQCEFTSRFVSGGFIEEDGLLWSEDGVLLAQSRQLAMVSSG